MFGTETIERFLYSSYDQFASVARCRPSCRCWPSGSPGSGCGRWRKWRGKWRTGSRRVVPVCAQRRPQSRWRWAFSSTSPVTGGRLVRWVRAGHESIRRRWRRWRKVGIDISTEFPKPWTDEVVRAADVVVTMGCGDACPSSPASGTRTGPSRTRQVRTSPRSVRSATRSSAGSGPAGRARRSRPRRAASEQRRAAVATSHRRRARNRAAGHRRRGLRYRRRYALAGRGRAAVAGELRSPPH